MARVYVWGYAGHEEFIVNNVDRFAVLRHWGAVCRKVKGLLDHY